MTDILNWKLSELNCFILSETIDLPIVLNSNKLLLKYELSFISLFKGARGGVVGLSAILQTGRSQVRTQVSLDFFCLPIPSIAGRGVDSASDRNEYQKSFWG
jgi:hypothetical protein